MKKYTGNNKSRKQKVLFAFSKKSINFVAYSELQKQYQPSVVTAVVK